MCACVHVSVCGYVCVCVKPGDCGVEIRTRRVSCWNFQAGCTCALNLRATDPAQLGFRSAYISATHCFSLLSVTVHRNPTTATAYLLFQDNWGNTPSLGARLQNLRLARSSAHAAAPILFVFVLIVTCTMACQHLTPGLRATLHIHSTHSINTSTNPTPTRLGQVYKRAHT